MIDVKKFVAARDNVGLSQNALAKAAGVSQQLIGEIERERVKTTKKIYVIAAALKVTPSYLDSDIPEPNDGIEELARLMRGLGPDEYESLLRYFKAATIAALDKSKTKPQK